jgi:microcystin-dependent protein
MEPTLAFVSVSALVWLGRSEVSSRGGKGGLQVAFDDVRVGGATAEAAARPRGLSRRRFLGGVGATVAAAGVASSAFSWLGATPAFAAGSPFVGEIRMFGGNFAPAGWGFCDGTLYAIAEFETLFNLIGTTYGGDGQNTFAVPDLRGRMPLHQGSAFVIGQNGGQEVVTLTTSQIPSHSHVAVGSSATGSTGSPQGVTWAVPASGNAYSASSPAAAMSSSVISAVGGGQPHDNMSPFLAISFIISFFGIYPSQS